jgi:single-strand DNA-binding protein
MNFNKVFLAGNLTRDPELKTTPSGTTICMFGMAINSGKEENKKVDYVNVVCFNKTAEFVSKYFNKGKAIFVEGRLNYRTWEKEGKKMSALDVVADRVEFIGKKEQEPEVETIDAGF